MKKNLRLLLGLVACLVVTACSLSKAYPAKRHYYVSATRSAISESQGVEILRVHPLAISTAFTAKGLVSRIGENEYVSDYYSEFFTSPNEMITDSLSAWIRGSGLYREVIGTASALTAGRVIEGTIDGIYADLRSSSDPKAVIALQLRYLNDSGSKPEVIAAKKYTRAVAVAATDASTLVEGWNSALDSILKEFEKDLESWMHRKG